MLEWQGEYVFITRLNIANSGVFGIRIVKRAKQPVPNYTHATIVSITFTDNLGVMMNMEAVSRKKPANYG